MFITRLLTIILPLILAAVLPFQAQATNYNLADLITNNSSIVAGNLTFSNFAASRSESLTGAGGCTPADASGIAVSTTILPLSGISLSAPISVLSLTGALNSCDLRLQYQVTSLVPITGGYVAFNGAAAGGFAFTQVVDTYRTLAGAVITQGQVTSLDPLNSLSTFLPFGGNSYLSFLVDKDIYLVAGGVQGFSAATISFVDQLHTEEGVEVPEPGTLALVVGSGLVLFGARWRKDQQPD